MEPMTQRVEGSAANAKTCGLGFDPGWRTAVGAVDQNAAACVDVALEGTYLHQVVDVCRQQMKTLVGHEREPPGFKSERTNRAKRRDSGPSLEVAA